MSEDAATLLDDLIAKARAAGADAADAVMVESIALSNAQRLGALERLEREDPTKASLVKLRYFVGLTIPQAADALQISRATAERYWAYSRARLYQWIAGNQPA